MDKKEQTKSFAGRDQADAVVMAKKWVNDLKQHGALRDVAVVPTPRGAKWRAVVTYKEG